MARCRTSKPRSTLPCLVLAAMALSGCGIHVEAIAQPPLMAAVLDAPSPPASNIFLPCIAGHSAPPVSAATAISLLVLGADRYGTSCAHGPATPIRLDRAPDTVTPQPVVATPLVPRNPDMVVTDELVGAVLTGTAEYWYQPVIGPA